MNSSTLFPTRFKDLAAVLLSALTVGLALGVGPVPNVRAAGIWYVSPTGNDTNSCLTPTTACLTLQTAINKASAGDTINVAAGMYTEQATVGKNLTIQGAGAANTQIKAPASLTADPFSQNVIVEISGTVTVTLSALTIAGPGPSGCNSLNYGVFVVGGATLNLSGAAILDIRDNPLSGCQNGDGLRAGSQALGQVGHANISGVTVSGYQKAGIVIDGPGSSGTIQTSTVTGIGSTPIIAQNGIQVSRGAVGAIISNTVTGNSCVSLPGGCTDDPATSPTADGSAGILLYQSGNAATDVGYNTLTGNQFSVWAVGAMAINVHNNRIAGLSGAGIAVWDADQWSGGIEASTTGPINSNNITGHDYGLLVRHYGAGVARPAVEAHFNRIVDTALDGAWSNIPFDASNNWWGCNAGPNALGCDTAASRVIYNPHLTLGLTTTPTATVFGGTATLTATLAVNSFGNDTSAQGFIPNGTGVTFAGKLGNAAPGTTVTTGGRATSTFTAGAVPGTASVSASVDSETVTAAITVLAPIPVTGNTLLYLPTVMRVH